MLLLTAYCCTEEFAQCLYVKARVNPHCQQCQKMGKKLTLRSQLHGWTDTSACTLAVKQIRFRKEGNLNLNLSATSIIHEMKLSNIAGMGARNLVH